jgi:hypothetical protein
MLPDFPSVKAHARNMLTAWTRRQVPNVAPLLREIGHSTQHEGASARFLRDDGTVDQIDYEKASAPLELTREEMRSFDLEKLQQKLVGLAEKFAEMQEAMMFRKLSRVVEEVGHTVDAEGDFRPHHFLAMIRKIDMSFDPDTNEPTGLTLVVHPSQVDRLLAKWKSWEEDPAFVAEYEKLLAEKREAWRARESNRRLDD